MQCHVAAFICHVTSMGLLLPQPHQSCRGLHFKAQYKLTWLAAAECRSQRYRLAAAAQFNSSAIHTSWYTLVHALHPAYACMHTSMCSYQHVKLTRDLQLPVIAQITMCIRAGKQPLLKGCTVHASLTVLQGSTHTTTLARQLLDQLLWLL